MARCRSCDASICWATTEAGKAIPLDADEHGAVLAVPGSNLVIVDSNRGVPVVAHISGARGNRRSHFASCPDAASHRKRGTT